MIQYVALLRGINSGRNPSVKMDRLVKLFVDLGFKNVRSVIASGNVLFDPADASNSADILDLEEQIELTIRNELGFNSSAIIRTKEEIGNLVRSAPFNKDALNEEVRANVTFIKAAKSEPLKLSIPTRGAGYEIIRATSREICFTIDTRSTKTPDIMSMFERELGKEITTRTWGTVEKIMSKFS